MFVSAFAMSAACGSQGPGDLGKGQCPQDNPTTTTQVATSGAATTGTGGNTSTATTNNAAATTSSGTGGNTQKYDPPDAGKEVPSRLHACHKLPYKTLGTMLGNRGAAIVPGDSIDNAPTKVTVFGNPNTTVGQVFGGSNSGCEMEKTPGLPDTGGDDGDPVCGNNELCFCNKDDKPAITPVPPDYGKNINCVDAGTGSTNKEARNGYCVAKPQTAGFLYFTGTDAFGVSKPDSRLAEKEEHTTASALKLMDIFVQAAPEIIQNIGDPAKAPACTINGKNKPMFDPSDGSCVEESVSCLIGTPASDDHMLLCNLILKKAKPSDNSDLAKKRIIAVAALLSAAHSCE